MSIRIRSWFLALALVVPCLTTSAAFANEGDKMDKPAGSDMGDKGMMKKSKKKDGMDKDKDKGGMEKDKDKGGTDKGKSM